MPFGLKKRLKKRLEKATKGVEDQLKKATKGVKDSALGDIAGGIIEHELGLAPEEPAPEELDYGPPPTPLEIPREFVVSSPIGEWKGKVEKDYSWIVEAHKEEFPDDTTWKFQLVEKFNWIKLSVKSKQEVAPEKKIPYGGKDVVISGDVKNFAEQVQHDVMIELSKDKEKNPDVPFILKDLTGVTVDALSTFKKTEELPEKGGFVRTRKKPIIDLKESERELKEKIASGLTVWAEFQETADGVRVAIQKGKTKETIDVPREQDKMPIDEWTEEEARRIKEKIREIAESPDAPYTVEVEGEHLVVPMGYVSTDHLKNIKLVGGIDHDGNIQAKGTADRKWILHPGNWLASQQYKGRFMRGVMKFGFRESSFEPVHLVLTGSINKSQNGSMLNVMKGKIEMDAAVEENIYAHVREMARDSGVEISETNLAQAEGLIVYLPFRAFLEKEPDRP